MPLCGTRCPVSSAEVNFNNSNNNNNNHNNI